MSVLTPKGVISDDRFTRFRWEPVGQAVQLGECTAGVVIPNTLESQVAIDFLLQRQNLACHARCRH